MPLTSPAVAGSTFWPPVRGRERRLAELDVLPAAAARGDRRREGQTEGVYPNVS